MKCPHCQTANPEEARFCMNCGSALARPGQEGAAGQSRSLDKFIPRELLAKFEAARANEAMAGERRVITMLFCDVKGSTAAAERVDPETWTEIMNGIFEYMIRPIYKYEGTVPRLMGDAILAFFGAPIAHEDDPERAVMAGLEIQAGIKPYQEEVRLRHGLEFGLRVGINTGLVVVGEIGSDLRMEYTAIGDAINLAARMEQSAAPGTVQISEDSYRLVAPFFDFEALGEVEVKGKSAPVKTYRPLARNKTPGQLRGLQGFSSPLVGRQAQLSFLREKLQEAKKGQGAVIALLGEAGLGKTSLVAEVQKSMQGPGPLWLRGEALSYARSTSYFPWRQIIRQSIGAAEDEPASELRAKLRQADERPSLPGGDSPFLEAILAVESDESRESLAGYEGEALVQRMIEAMRRYLCALAAESPLIVALDDLHWADEASLHLLVNIADLANTNPILFLGMLRPDRSAPSWETMQRVQEKTGQGYHAIWLEPLPAEQAEALLANLLGESSLPEGLRSLILEKAGGNPFFVEELIRSLIDSGQIVRRDGRWQATGEPGRIELPDSLRGVLSARIDRLPEAAKHVLQIAAVIGQSFDLKVLKRLSGVNGGLDEPIRQLREAGLLEPRGEEYAFRHVLIQESAYGSILLKSRAALHRQTGEILEEIHADRLEEFAPLLAHHYYNAGDPRSLQYDLMAGEKAARLYANAEAVSHFSRALESVRRHGTDSAQAARTFAQLGHALELSGRHEQALSNYDEMIAFARQNHEKSMEMAALMSKATIYSIFSQHHDSELSEQTLLQALEISSELGDRAVQARLNWNLMLNFLFSKRLDRALQHGELALSLARGAPDREQLAFVLNDLSRLYTCQGEFDKAYAAVREARQLWEALNNETMFIDSLGAEAEVGFNAGNYEESLERSSLALQMSEKIGNQWGQAYNRMLMGFVRIDQGEIGPAIRLMNEAIRLGDQANLVASSVGTRADLAWVYACYGDMDRGLQLAEEALEASETKQPEWRHLPLAIKVRIQLLAGQIRAAEQSAGGAPLRPISIPYARYTILVEMANIELALAQGKPEQALQMANALLEQAAPLTRPDIPEVMRTKAEILMHLGRPAEAQALLVQARAAAETLGAKHELWPILASLAAAASALGSDVEAEQALDEARQTIQAIAGSLEEAGLRDKFLNAPRVRALRM